MSEAKGKLGGAKVRDKRVRADDWRARRIFTPDVIEFHLTWVIVTAAPRLQYRAIRGIARRLDPPERLPVVILSQFSGLRLAIGQWADHR